MPLSTDLSVVDALHGKFITLNADTGVSQTIAKTRCWAPCDVEVFRWIVKPGMVVVDVGANIGHHSVVFSKLAGRDGRVLCFEPQKVLCRILKANLLLNDAHSAMAFGVALGEKTQKAEMCPIDYSVPNNLAALGINRKQGKLPLGHHGEAIDIVAGDDFLGVRRLLRRRIDFIKIDVQAYELYVLKGLRRVLGTMKPTLFIEIAPYWMSRIGYDYREIYRYLGALRYRIYMPRESLNLETHKPREWNGDMQDEWDILAVAG